MAVPHGAQSRREAPYLGSWCSGHLVSIELRGTAVESPDAAIEPLPEFLPCAPSAFDVATVREGETLHVETGQCRGHAVDVLLAKRDEFVGGGERASCVTAPAQDSREAKQRARPYRWVGLSSERTIARDGHGGRTFPKLRDLGFGKQLRPVRSGHAPRYERQSTSWFDDPTAGSPHGDDGGGHRCTTIRAQTCAQPVSQVGQRLSDTRCDGIRGSLGLQAHLPRVQLALLRDQSPA
ncbi:MAG: hypothetical protein H0V80_15470 [Acidobacteria bacterium]|nr:hypothetical protein [Acidobacteriota bacterium]